MSLGRSHKVVTRQQKHPVTSESSCARDWVEPEIRLTELNISALGSRAAAAGVNVKLVSVGAC